VDSGSFTSMGHTTKNIWTWKNDFKKQATSVTRVHCKVASTASFTAMGEKQEE
jgi:hypothetical protein